MRILDLAGEVASGGLLVLFVPVAVLVVGTSVALLARLLIELIERL